MTALTDDRHLDCNAIGGLLIDLFGREMTDAGGCCDGCGAVHAVGALVVYRSGPGDVIRCPGCDSVLMVSVPLPAGPRLYFSALRWLQPPA